MESEKAADGGAHQDQPGDPRLRQCEVVFHPPCPFPANRGARAAEAAPARRAAESPAESATVKPSTVRPAEVGRAQGRQRRRSGARPRGQIQARQKCTHTQNQLNETRAIRRNRSAPQALVRRGSAAPAGERRWKTSPASKSAESPRRPRRCAASRRANCDGRRPRVRSAAARPGAHPGQRAQRGPAPVLQQRGVAIPGRRCAEREQREQREAQVRQDGVGHADLRRAGRHTPSQACAPNSSSATGRLFSTIFENPTKAARPP